MHFEKIAKLPWHTWSSAFFGTICPTMRWRCYV